MPEHEDGGRTALLTMGLAGSTLALALALGLAGSTLALALALGLAGSTLALLGLAGLTLALALTVGLAGSTLALALTLGLAGFTYLALGLTTAPVSSYVCHVMLAVQTRWEDSHTRGEGWHVAQHNTIEDDRLPTND